MRHHPGGSLVLAFALALLTTTAGQADDAAVPAFDLQGHRGARGLAPENTLPAFERALETGVTTLELDLGLSRDGVLVVTHDAHLNPDLTRGPDGRWLEREGPAVQDLSVREIKRYDVGRVRPGSNLAARVPEQAAVDGARIPTLAEVVGRVSDPGAEHIRFNVETKLSPLEPEATPSPAAFAQALAREVVALGIGERTTVQSFDWRTLDAVRTLDPALATACLTAEQSWLDTLERGRAGASPWLAGHDADDYPDVPGLVQAAGCAVWSPYHGDLDRATLMRAHELGLRVVPWTVNAPDRMALLIELGVDGLITDYPDRLRTVLADRNRALPPPVALAPGARRVRVVRKRPMQLAAPELPPWVFSEGPVMTIPDAPRHLLQQRADLAEFGLRATEATGLEDLLSEAAQMVGSSLDVGFVKVLQYLPEEKRFLVRAGCGWDAGVVGRAKVGTEIESPAGYALQTGKPVISNDLEAEERFIVPPLLREYKVKSAVNVIIRNGAHIFGVLEADSREPREFTDDDVKFLQGYATILSFAIEQARLMEQNAELARQQEVLLRDLHHRVANNNQQLLSLIRLQLGDVCNVEARENLEKVAHRVLALSRINEQLRPGRSAHVVDLGQHLMAVISCLFDFRRGAAANVRLETAMAQVEVGTEDAQAVGLIVNEFLTNSFKYAFGEDGGVFRATLEARDGTALITLSDDGAGLPDELKEGLGFRLIRALAQQVEGEASWSSEDGTKLEIRIPIEPPPALAADPGCGQP